MTVTVRRRVAIVDDRADNRLLLRAILRGYHETVEYGSGPEALAAFGSEPPDVVLLDIALPGMDGVEVLRQMRADARLRAIPVVALTAHALAGDRDRYLAAGFDAYVGKPISDQEELLAVIARACRAGHARQPPTGSDGA